MFAKQSIEPGTSRRISGFTVVELMITVALSAVLMALAVPSFNQMIMTSRLTAQANEMVSAINLARSEAIKRNASISFCRVPSATATVCAAQIANWQHWIVSTGAGTVVRRGLVNTFSGTLVVQSTLNGDQVVFGPDGLARTGGALVNDRQINICSTRANQGNVRQVVLGAGSRMSTQIASQQC